MVGLTSTYEWFQCTEVLTSIEIDRPTAAILGFKCQDASSAEIAKLTFAQYLVKRSTSSKREEGQGDEPDKSLIS